jgi:hypothetical protein
MEQVVGDLDARLPAAHDEHGSRWQIAGIAVRGRV